MEKIYPLRLAIVERAEVNFDGAPPAGWPFDIPCIRQISEEGLEFDQGVTILVGENGSGKSTLVEAVAEAYGIDVRGGHGARRYAVSEPKGPLGEAIELILSDRPGPRVKRSAGFFLRSETAFEVFKFMSHHRVPGYGERHLGTLSHGEGYLQVLDASFAEPGLYLLDEPEAPLSFHSCLTLIATLDQVVKGGSQVICATHSPLVAAMPGARLLELGEHGIRETSWEDLEMVAHWRRYLDGPDRYLRHLLDG